MMIIIISIIIIIVIYIYIIIRGSNFYLSVFNDVLH